METKKKGTKKPKLKAYPKPPKASASVQAFEKWRAICARIAKDNKQKLDAYNSKINSKNKVKATKERIKKEVASMKKYKPRKAA